MWETGVKDEFNELDPDRSGRDAPRKQIRLPTFSSATEKKTPVTRVSSKQIRHIGDLRKYIGRLSKSGTGESCHEVAQVELKYV